jgi:predicted ferric reductase
MEYRKLLKALVGLAAAGLVILFVFVALLFLEMPGSAPIKNLFQALLKLDSVQLWWFVTRSAGLTGYFLMWLSMVWGFAVSTKMLNVFVDGTYSYEFHEYLSLLGLGFVFVHVIVLMLDRYLPFSLFQVLIPFIDPYRPLWVGLGIISMYLFLVVTVTFYMRKTLGMQAFRLIHMFSILGYFGTTLHGFFAGTDSALPVTKFLYLGTFLIIVFMSIYWAALSFMAKKEKDDAALKAALQTALKRNAARRKPSRAAR